MSTSTCFRILLKILGYQIGLQNTDINTSLPILILSVSDVNYYKSKIGHRCDTVKVMLVTKQMNKRLIETLLPFIIILWRLH